MTLTDYIANQGEVLFIFICKPWFWLIQIVIFWTACHWHNFDCCEGKLTVPSSWTSWRLSLRWAAYKIQCECRWTSLILGNLCIFSFQLDLMWMYMNITSFKQSFHFQTDKYLSVSKRLDLSRSLNLTEVQIKTWWEVVKMMTKMLWMTMDPMYKDHFLSIRH